MIDWHKPCQFLVRCVVPFLVQRLGKHVPHRLIHFCISSFIPRKLNKHFSFVKEMNIILNSFLCAFLVNCPFFGWYCYCPSQCDALRNPPLSVSPQWMGRFVLLLLLPPIQFHNGFFFLFVVIILINSIILIDKNWYLLCSKFNWYRPFAAGWVSWFRYFVKLKWKISFCCCEILVDCQCCGFSCCFVLRKCKIWKSITIFWSSWFSYFH